MSCYSRCVNKATFRAVFHLSSILQDSILSLGRPVFTLSVLYPDFCYPMEENPR